MKTVLILGYGNPLRGDDGAGWAVVERLQAGDMPASVDVLVQHQLLPEMIPAVSEAGLAIFVDATATGVPGTVQVQMVEPGDSLVKPFTHQLDPETVVSNALALYGRAPRAVIVTISGQSFGYEEVLTDVVATAVAEAVTTIEKIIRDWRSEIGDLPATNL